MAAIWKGSLTFGLVNIPEELKTAVRADHIISGETLLALRRSGLHRHAVGGLLQSRHRRREMR